LFISKSFKDRFFKTRSFRKADAKVDLFPETPKHFKRKIEEILNLILKTLIYNCVLKHIFLYRLQEDKHTYIPYYNNKRKIREEVLTHP